SPPGYITTPRFSPSSNRIVQFCWKGVTGMIAALSMVIACVSLTHLVKWRGHKGGGYLIRFRLAPQGSESERAACAARSKACVETPSGFLHGTHYCANHGRQHGAADATADDVTENAAKRAAVAHARKQRAAAHATNDAADDHGQVPHGCFLEGCADRLAADDPRYSLHDNGNKRFHVLPSSNTGSLSRHNHETPNSTKVKRGGSCEV